MKRILQNLGLVVLAAVMMSFGWWELTGLVMLGGFVPLLMLAARREGSARGFWAMLGWMTLFTVLWYAMTIWWVWYATPAGPIAATFFGWLYTTLPFMFWFFVSKRAPKALSYTVLVSVWIVGEWYYNFNQASFPWLNIGNGFAHDPWAVQWYEWTGIYGGTLWVLVSSILIYEFLVVGGLKPFRWRRLIAPVSVIVIPIAVSLAMYWSYHEPERTAKVTLVQPNIDSYTEKYEISQELQTANLVELAAHAPRDVDFIVMPETAINETGLTEGALEQSRSLGEIRRFASENYPEAMVIVGATTYKPYGANKATKTARGSAERGYYDIYNTAIALPSGGGFELHHKSKLVIGVEMMPDWWWVKYLGKIVVDLGGMTGQLGYDDVRKVFSTGSVNDAGSDSLGGGSSERVSVGAGICYESIYGEYFAEFVRNGAETMFVITNDGWWSDSPGYRQHFDMARLRAVETRRSISRSANTGRSGFISPRGDVRETLEWDVRGAITDDVALSRHKTLYVRFGDWLCRISLLVLGLSVLYFVAYTVRRKNLLVK